MPRWLDRAQHIGVGIARQPTEHLTHLVWQLLAYRHVRRRFPELPFDVIHHITYGGIRHPSRLGRLGVPFVLGPVGGGERAPFALRRGYRLGGWVIDLLRDIHTALIRFDPITRQACADALVVYVKTNQSRWPLPPRHAEKIVAQMEIGTRRVEATTPPPRAPGEPLRLVYAGRFLYWKGMHLGLQALARARARGVDARLSMVGQGPDEASWRALAEELGLGDEAVSWIGWVDHRRMTDFYRDHHALLFPSLHDSSGNAVLESLCLGLPVVCLDLGGPGELVTADCGRVVATTARSEAEVVEALADALEELAGDPDLHSRLADGALARARSFRWPALVGAVYQDIAKRLTERPNGARPMIDQLVDGTSGPVDVSAS
jgi:glycosyltransferase involved in cell wall biosynthesis